MLFRSFYMIEIERKGSAFSIDFDHIKVIGSDAGPKGPTGQPRSLETAHIQGEELARSGKGLFEPDASSSSHLLSYTTLKTEAPYNHEKVYNEANDKAVEEAFAVHPEAKAVNDLPAEVQEAIGAIAQNATLNAAFEARGKQADDFRLEVAGSFSMLIKQLIEKMKDMKNNTTAIIPAGTHGGTMENLLKQVMVWEDDKGETHRGFEHIEEIGGAFMASEGYNVEIDTNDKGTLHEINVTFHDRNRRKGIYNARLDMDKVEEAAAFYMQLHPEIPASGLEKH